MILPSRGSWHERRRFVTFSQEFRVRPFEMLHPYGHVETKIIYRLKENCYTFLSDDNKS